MAEQQTSTDAATAVSERAQRAADLFEFLFRAQQSLVRPIYTTQGYERDGNGRVIWMHALPDHAAIRPCAAGTDTDPFAPVLTIDRVRRPEPPAPSELVLACLTSSTLDDIQTEPTLRTSVPASALPAGAFPGAGVPEDDPEHPSPPVDVSALSGVVEAFETWLARWRLWAEQERVDQPARQAYSDLFGVYTTATNHPEELELVLGIGLLAWKEYEDADVVSRHLVTVPISVGFDDDSGRLTVARNEALDPMAVELDMLDPALTTSPGIPPVRESLKGYERHPLLREEMGLIPQRLVHILDSAGEYIDSDQPPVAGPRARAAFAPAIVLRKRSSRGLMEVLRTIVDQVTATGFVPEGIVPLVDPDHRVDREPDSMPGAVVSVDGESFLPLPVNDQQLEIIKRVDSSQQTLVQGPPGTGKTHTAAALLSHLLAQGKRVLVTAQTDRALQEVRAKLPDAIRPLSVSVVGASRDDMADLRLAVQTISENASSHDPHTAAKQIETTLQHIDELRRERANLYHQLREAREAEVTETNHGAYAGTLARIAERFEAQRDSYDWLLEYVEPTSSSSCPLSDNEAEELLTLLTDPVLEADAEEAQLHLPQLESLPDAEGFVGLLAGERNAVQNLTAFTTLTSHSALDGIKALEPSVRAEIQDKVRSLAREADELERRDEQWMNEALADVRAGRASTWQGRADTIRTLIRDGQALLGQVGPATRVTVSGGDRTALVAMAKTVATNLEGGASFKLQTDGRPKLGPLSPRWLKDSRELFECVRVDRQVPTEASLLRKFVTYDEAEATIGALDEAWPLSVRIPDEDTLVERLQWHSTEIELVSRVLALGHDLQDLDAELRRLGVPSPNWTDLASIVEFSTLVDAANASDAAALARQPLDELVARLAGELVHSTPRCVARLHEAVLQRDGTGYATSHSRLARLHEAARQLARKADLLAQLRPSVPRLATALVQSPDDLAWRQRLPSVEAAWHWASTGAWITEQTPVDVNSVQASLTIVENRLREQVERLAALRAWSHAVAPDRLSGQAQADLTQYAQLVKSLGRGTGRYAEQKRASIRRAMDRCRPAVPVWIMPIYRIAEQLLVEPNMFDVVIVDEASQAGMEATFLQYLAPKMVVIGDDRQVSPSAVGVERQQLRDLATQYLAGNRYKDSWQDPTMSLFNAAAMWFGKRITLVEHRRCMPEIIGFSNRIVYEPDNTRLIPVRQYGADRLDPIKAVHVSTGYERGSSSNRINPAEIDAIVDQIEKCLVDPAYDGKTFGVISLLGTWQAKAIEKKLLDRLTPEDWRERDLRCGDAADFQGSERDVIFLSMVAAPEEGRRIMPLTAETYVQRYNVATSRARDQMWLFHSISLDDVSNPEDMRFALLDYVYGVISRGADDMVSHTFRVSEMDRVEPFDSLFEQRVYNRLIDRGYTVTPQYEALGYHIDLVVVGGLGKLAIECDGDHWHGPDAYRRDLARQRELERCGWHFFRIRESAFYVDPAAVMEELWELLEAKEIHPSGWTPPRPHAVDVAIPAPAPAVDSLTSEVEHLEPAPHLAPAETMATLLTHEPELRQEVEQPIVATATPDPSRVAVASQPEVVARVTPTLPIYTTYAEVAAPLDAAANYITDSVVAIVAVEGPILGSRLHTAYVHSRGGQRVGKNIAMTLDQALLAAEREGRLVSEDPLAEGDPRSRTYRLPEQPRAVVRSLGPRSLDEVPPLELAHLIWQASTQMSDADRAALYRRVLTDLRLVRLTSGVEARLNQAHELAEAEGLI